MKYNIKAQHIVDSGDKELALSVVLYIKEGPKNSHKYDSPTHTG